MKALKSIAVYSLGILLWLAIWLIISFAVGNEIIFPSPLSVLTRLGALLTTTVFWSNAGMSLLRVLGGIVFAVIAAIPLAALSSKFAVLYKLMKPAVTIIKATPVVSFIFLAYIALRGRPDSLTVLITSLIVFPITYESIYDALRGVSRELVEVAEVCGCGFFEKLRYLWIPTAIPSFITSGKVSIGLAWKAGVAAEALTLLPNAAGIGYRIADSKIQLETTDIFAWTLTIVILSLVFELLFSLISKKITDKLL